jgi:hypothetical protein
LVKKCPTWSAPGIKFLVIKQGWQMNVLTLNWLLSVEEKLCHIFCAAFRPDTSLHSLDTYADPSLGEAWRTTTQARIGCWSNQPMHVPAWGICPSQQVGQTYII